MKLGSLVVEIGADSTGLDKAVTTTETKLNALSKRARTATASFAKYTAAAGIAGTAITAALVAKAASAIDAQAKLAQQLNTTSSSMATLERAGELSGISMEKIATSGRTLTTRLGEISGGTGPAAESFKRLGLSIDDISSMPLDQRINAINTAIRANIPATEQAAVAADFFGERMGTAILTISGGTIDQARRETELFGLALSDVDAAKVEMANDAMSTFSMASDGIIQQLTVQLAPILKAISDRFVGMAEDSGGFGNIAIGAFEKVVNAAAFVADAVDGIKRIFELVGDRIIIVISRAMAIVSKIVSGILSGLSNIPGIDFSETVNSLNEFSSTSFNIVKQARDNIDETLSRPMAGEGLRQFVEDAKAAGQAAAEAAVAARSMGGDAAGVPEVEVDTKLQARLDAIRNANATEIELLMQKQQMENEALRIGLEQKALTEEEFMALAAETKARHEEEMTEIERNAAEARQAIVEAEARAKEQVWNGMFSNLSSLMNTQSRKLFEIGKVAAISSAILDGKEAIIASYKAGTKVGGPYVGAAYAATSALATGNMINNIKSQQFGGGGGGGAVAIGQGSSNVAAQPQQMQPTQTMMVSGIDEGELFTGGRVRALVGELIEYQRNGGQVILA